MSRRFNYKEVGENEDWVLFWTDCSVNIERVMDMRRYQVLTFFRFSDRYWVWIVFDGWWPWTLKLCYKQYNFQKINHFPGMSEICRKDLLARNMNRMQKLFPKEYNICPRSWCLPAE